MQDILRNSPGITCGAGEGGQPLADRPVIRGQSSGNNIFVDGVRDAESRATTWLERVGLGDRLQSRPDQLSGGQQQRVAIARALSTEPALILADEPTGNLDSRSATEIGELLREISAAYGRSVLMVTHDPRIAGFAERLVLMRDGRIIDDLDLDDAPEGPRLALERAGLL